MKEKYIDDLKDIKEMMNRSSRFISLSGLSGITGGIAALIGAYYANRVLIGNNEYLIYDRVQIPNSDIYQLLIIAILVILVTLTGGIFFTTRKSKKDNLEIWDQQTKRMLINLLIPLAAGGTLCLMLVFKGFIGITLPLTLIFYGLALINVSKYSFADLRSLGIVEIILGLLAFHFLPYSLILWAIGFGLFHIIYGLYVHWKYKS